MTARSGERPGGTRSLACGNARAHHARTRPQPPAEARRAQTGARREARALAVVVPYCISHPKTRAPDREVRRAGHCCPRRSPRARASEVAWARGARVARRRRRRVGHRPRQGAHCVLRSEQGLYARACVRRRSTNGRWQGAPRRRQPHQHSRGQIPGRERALHASTGTRSCTCSPASLTSEHLIELCAGGEVGALAPLGPARYGRSSNRMHAKA